MYQLRTQDPAAELARTYGPAVGGAALLDWARHGYGTPHAQWCDIVLADLRNGDIEVEDVLRRAAA